MPSFNYDAMHRVAEALLEKFGTYGTVEKKTFTTPDSTTPWVRVATDTDPEILMVDVPWSASDVGRYFSEDVIKSTSKAIILWDDLAPIAVDDYVTYLGKKKMVVAIKPINPAGTGLIRVCALSGGAS